MVDMKKKKSGESEEEHMVLEKRKADMAKHVAPMNKPRPPPKPAKK